MANGLNPKTLDLRPTKLSLSLGLCIIYISCREEDWSCIYGLVVQNETTSVKGLIFLKRYELVNAVARKWLQVEVLELEGYLNKGK